MSEFQAELGHPVTLALKKWLRDHKPGDVKHAGTPRLDIVQDQRFMGYDSEGWVLWEPAGKSRYYIPLRIPSTVAGLIKQWLSR